MPKYKNGREARVGDAVFGIDGQGYPMAGVVIRTLAEKAQHNIHVARVTGIVPGYRSEAFLHAEDALSCGVPEASEERRRDAIMEYLEERLADAGGGFADANQALAIPAKFLLRQHESGTPAAPARTVTPGGAEPDQG